jgi:multidrug efflux pump subunit AcrA (membrane-fusion protein)
VIAVIPTADRSKATVKVRVALNVRDPRIVPDMGVKVSFLEAAPKPGASQPQGVRAPAAAIVQRSGGTVAFVVGDKSVVSQHAVSVGRQMGDDRQVLSGLSAGDQVVTDPPAELKDGSRVLVTPEGGDSTQ